MGAKPVILTADPELIHKINCEHKSNFLDRPRRVPGGINPDPKRALMLGNLPVPKWQVLRKTLAANFSNKNLHAMISPINELTDRLLQKLENAVPKTK